jgi:hypothetical protein
MRNAIVGKYFVAEAGVWDFEHTISPGSHGRVLEQVGDEYRIENLGVSTPTKYIVPSAFFTITKCRFFDSRIEMRAACETMDRFVCLGDYEHASLGMKSTCDGMSAFVGA